jgi:hypothetical protein
MKLLTNYNRRIPRATVPAVVALIVLGTGFSWAQPVPPVTPADLAKYDTNKNGVLDPAELATKRAAEAATPDEPIALSPFEVKSEATGYFQSNTMSGTRLNSKIEDLGQSITVMTKEQMNDFAMLNINDVFDYMASTEGTSTYSDFVVDRTGAVTDNVTFDPNNANRVRGLGNANVAFNNIATTGRVPVDKLWLDSIELSRGPNANIFGLGNAAGTVNQVPATANVGRNFARVEARVDDHDGWRGSLDVNRVLLKNKLALRGSLAHQHTGFIRKPSGEDSRRLSLQLKARPFEKTTLALSWYNYRNVGTRPNFTTPRDNITAWIAAGRPAWDPVTRLITLNGVTYGQGMVAGSTTPITTLPSYFNNSPSDGRSIMRVGNEGLYFTTPVVTSLTDPLAAVNNNIRYVSTSPVNSYGAAQPLFATYAALSDKSIYDWENINLMAANKQWDDVNTYLAQLDQVFLHTPKQTLAAQVTYMREDAKQIQDLPLGPASVNGVIGELYADPNSRNLDGSPNAYFGQPYLRTKEHYLRERPLLWETTRAQLAYRLDFARDSGWSKWLGTQQFLGYYEYKDQKDAQYSWRRTAKSGNHAWLQQQFNAGIPLANRTTGGNTYPSSNNHMRIYEQYYVGNTPGGGVEYAPGRFPEGATVPFNWGNTGGFRADPVVVGYTPSPDGSGGGRQTIVKTQGGVLQSTFLNGKLVTTFGLREDKVSDRNKVFATLTPDLLNFDYAASGRYGDGSTWRLAQGETKTMSIVARPFRDLRFLKNEMSNGSGFRRFLAEAVSNFSPFYNKSDSFIPQGPAVDLFLRPLPNQTGTSKDFGFWMSFLDGKVSLRYTHYRTDQTNLRNGDISTIAQRVLRADGLNAADRWALQDRATDWVRQLNPTFTDAQVKAEVAKTMGLSQEQVDSLENAIANGRLSAIQDYVSKGDELEFNVNLTRAWTVSGSATKTVAINQNAGSTIEEWIAQRIPIWESVEDPRFPDPARPGRNMRWRYISGAAYTAFGYDANNSAATNYVTFVEGPLAVYRQLEGRPRPQMAKYNFRFSTRYQLSGMTEHKILRNVTVGGAMRWIDKKAIGFLGVQSLPATISALDPNKPVYSPAETQVDLFVSYRMRLFRDKIRANFQLNGRNVGEKGGGLLPTAVFPDGTPLAYRIVDPRQFILSASFEL